MVRRVLDAQRAELLRLRSSGAISNDVMHRCERDSISGTSGWRSDRVRPGWGRAAALAVLAAAAVSFPAGRVLRP